MGSAGGGTHGAGRYSGEPEIAVTICITFGIFVIRFSP
jgi:hypothetical protein